MVAEQPEVRRRTNEVRLKTREGLRLMESSVLLTDDGIVEFDVNSEGTIVNRYAPFYFYQHARYSAGLVRWPNHAKITTMRNPWMDFQSVNLGAICARYGGGGHQRVGSIVLDMDRQSQAAEILHTVVHDIRIEDQSSTT